MKREDFDVILKSWELSDDINKMIRSWKESNKDIISRFIMLGQDEISIYFSITDSDAWYEYGIRGISVYLYDIKNNYKINSKIVLEVDIQFLLWPFLCANSSIRVISTDYQLKDDEKLILTGIYTDSINIEFNESIDLSSYTNYEHLNISNISELIYLNKFNVNHIDSLSLFCYYNKDVEQFLESFSYLINNNLLSSNASIYLSLVHDIDYPLKRLLMFINSLNSIGFQLHLKINRKDTKFFKQSNYTIDILKEYFTTVVFNNKIY